MMMTSLQEQMATWMKIEKSGKKSLWLECM